MLSLTWMTKQISVCYGNMLAIDNARGSNNIFYNNILLPEILLLSCS